MNYLSLQYGSLIRWDPFLKTNYPRSQQNFKRFTLENKIHILRSPFLKKFKILFLRKLLSKKIKRDNFCNRVNWLNEKKLFFICAKHLRFIKKKKRGLQKSVFWVMPNFRKSVPRTIKKLRWERVSFFARLFLIFSYRNFKKYYTNTKLKTYFFWKASVVSNPIKVFTKVQSKKKHINIKNYNLKNRIDIVLKLLAPSTSFFILKKNFFNFNFFFFTHLIWPGEYLDILILLFKSNPFFINTKLYDSSLFFINTSTTFKKVIYYIFKIPLFSNWLVIFFNLESSLSNFSKKLKVISIETAFKAMGWIERESSELFGIFFFGKKNNRKLITDYFLKIYPMLKWVPSIGFSELSLSSDGSFVLRNIKIQNISLA